MPGRVTAVEVSKGEKVAKGQRLLTLEAMKMEHALTAPFDGTVAGAQRRARRAGQRGAAAGQGGGFGMTKSPATPTPAHSLDHQLERLIFFSDAVFAIAMTVLIIEVHPPQLGLRASDGDHLIALANLSPNFIAFFISFAVIGAFWAGHHRAFGLARHWSPRLMMPNLLILVSIVFMPFATAYMGSNMGQRVPAMLYDLVMLITGLLNIRLVRIATTPPVVGEDIDRADDCAHPRPRLGSRRRRRAGDGVRALRPTAQPIGADHHTAVAKARHAAGREEDCGRSGW